MYQLDGEPQAFALVDAVEVNFMREVWRPTFITKYEVSNLGNVRRIDSGRVLKYHDTGKGYFRVCLFAGRGQCHWVMVHVLVARAFIGPCPPGKEVNHKDGNKGNCRARNLEYKTHKKNMEHAVVNGLTARGNRHRASTHPDSYNRKYSDAVIRRVRREYAKGGFRQVDVGERYGISKSMMSLIIRNEIYKHVSC